MTKLEKQYIVRTAETIYRVKPSAVGESVTGSDGIDLEWSDDGGKVWHGTFYVPADALDAFSEAIQRFTSKERDVN
jgi:hypothetical protein